MARDRQSYEAVLKAVGVCVAARIPFLLWGDPGAGKTAVVESASQCGWHVETLICSHYEPSDFAGLPIVNGDRVTLAPPGWASRVAEEPQGLDRLLRRVDDGLPGRAGRRVATIDTRPGRSAAIARAGLVRRRREPCGRGRFGLGVGGADGQPFRALRVGHAVRGLCGVDRDWRLAGVARAGIASGSRRMVSARRGLVAGFLRTRGASCRRSRRTHPVADEPFQRRGRGTTQPGCWPLPITRVLARTSPGCLCTGRWGRLWAMSSSPGSVPWICRIRRIFWPTRLVTG